MATGVAHRLFVAGFHVVVTERSDPWCVRRRTAFAGAVSGGTVDVGGVEARLARLGDLPDWRWERRVAVLVAPTLPIGLQPDLLVDARVLKHGHDTTSADAPRVIGVGPGFRVGRDCHAAVETQRGPRLGQVLYDGETEPFSGIPGEVGGEGARRVLRTTVAGDFFATVEIGSFVQAGAPVGSVGGHAVIPRVGGIVRGLIADGTAVRRDQKVGDIDPRGDPTLCDTLSDKAIAVGRGVHEAALTLLRRDAGHPPI